VSEQPPPDLRHIHFFGPGCRAEPAAKDVLGGKGHGLAAMSRAGLPVPPGCIIESDCCRVFHASERNWPVGLEEELRQAIDWLERTTGRGLGRGPKPLKVAVRSGAAVSMPGMMDTILNVGLHPDLEPFYPEKEEFWNSLADFVRAYGRTVAAIEERVFDDAVAGAGRGISAEERARTLLEAYRSAAGRAFTSDPWEMLVAAVAAVFESWESARAVQYRARSDIRGLAGTAVTVQAMFPSERSGVLFTEDPNRPDSGRILIEAARGLGEALVRGQVEPDVYCVDRASREVVERRAAGEGLSLSDEQVLDLAGLGLKVEEYFDTPVDVEWGLAEGRLVLLQSRPIRGLEVARAVPRVRREEIERLRGLAAGLTARGGKAVWAVHNLAETLPAPTPLTWDIVGGGFMARGFVELYRDMGLAPSDRVGREGFLELVGGRIYADLERAAQLFFGRFPLEYDVQVNDGATGFLLGPPTSFNIERAGAGFLLRLPWYVYRMIRAGHILWRAARGYLDEFEKRVLPAFLSYVERAGGKDLEDLSDEGLLAELAERERVVLTDFGKELLKPTYLAAHYSGRLTGTLEQVLGPAEGRALAARLLAALDNDKTVEANTALFRVARGERNMESFLEEFGHRAVNEFELSEPRWREDASYPLARVEQYRGAPTVSPVELHEKKKAERLAAEESLGRQLAEAGAASLESEVRADLAGAQRHMPFRETCKHYLMMGVALLRAAIQEIAGRWGIGRDVYFLHRPELAEFPAARARLMEEVGRRKMRWRALQRLALPEVVTSDDLEAIGREPPPVPAGDGVFSGTGVATGVGTGAAQVVRTPADVGVLGTGYVLVCPSTDPGWTPLFVHAAGLVVERGGMLSHGAIVARDFGIPAVVLPDAIRLIPDGAQVRVDGSRGSVELVGKTTASSREDRG
jgi:pyruvate,water dikinase